MKYAPIFILFAFGWAMTSCNLEQEIDIQLPDYQGVPVLECYLEPGQPFTLLLSRSARYFDPFPAFDDNLLENILLDGATVRIRHKERDYRLRNELIFNPFTGKIFNYFSQETIPADFDNDFELFVTTKEGTTIEARTRILRPVPMDSVIVQFREGDTLARVLTYLTDPPGVDNYFRRVLHKSSLDSLAQQDFVTDDRFVEDRIVFGTGYDFVEGDTVINTMFHIDVAYYNFLQSIFNARASNGNPFGQPGAIISNLKGSAGAIGIFTGLSYDRKTTVIRR